MALLAASPVAAQETGTVRGTVTLVENSGLVDGAVILVLGTGAFALTQDGRFEISNVPVGSFQVTAQRNRLTAASRTVTVTAGGTATADFELNLSPVREEVTVTAAAVGAAVTLQAFNAVTTVDSLQIAREAPSSIGERSSTSRGSPTAASVRARAVPSSAASAATGSSSSRTASAPATSRRPRITTG